MQQHVAKDNKTITSFVCNALYFYLLITKKNIFFTTFKVKVETIVSTYKMIFLEQLTKQHYYTSIFNLIELHRFISSLYVQIKSFSKILFY